MIWNWEKLVGQEDLFTKADFQKASLRLVEEQILYQSNARQKFDYDLISKFETEFKTTEGQFKMNDSVEVRGFAKAFAGNNIDGAKVNYRVVRKTSYPYWRWWMWGSYPSTPDTEIINQDGRDVNRFL